MRSGEYPFVLIAEDVANDVELLRRSFRQAGIPAATHVVSDGEECMSYLSGTGKYGNREEYPLPNLLLLDLKMPRKNGFEVLRWIRAQASLAALRVVVLTSSERMRDINMAYDLGANSFLTKPLNFIDFTNMVQVMLKYWLEQSKTPEVSRQSKLQSDGSEEGLIDKAKSDHE